MIPSDDFVFSQSALEAYRECPRRFELRFIQDLRWPGLETQDAIEHEAQIERGEEFHQLLHMHSLGVDESKLEATIRDDEIRLWWRNYLGWQKDNLPLTRWSEISLTAPIGASLVTAKYDVIAREPGGGFLIVDWKSGKVDSRARLTRRLQTSVYPFVLARAGESLNDGRPVTPESIRMVYWYAQTGETLEFNTTPEQIERTDADLKSIIDEIAARFEFPKTNDERRCRFCVYRSLCERGVEAGSLAEFPDDKPEPEETLIIDLADIEEIAF